MNSIQIELEQSWKKELLPEFEKDYLKKLRQFLLKEKKAQKVIYPQGKEYFEAFKKTSFSNVKAVILGQDPYHGPNQAHGLCFSVKKNVPLPPSLRNIYKELQSDVGVPSPKHGCLEAWTHQGVLLLNATLSVEAHRPGSHQNRGWEKFTDHVIHLLNEKQRGLAFVLWGAYAQKKGAFIDPNRHCVIKSPHPSPLSAYRGFFGSRPFSKINTYLVSQGKAPIDWSLK